MTLETMFKIFIDTQNMLTKRFFQSLLAFFLLYCNITSSAIGQGKLRSKLYELESQSKSSLNKNGVQNRTLNFSNLKKYLYLTWIENRDFFKSSFILDLA